MQIKFAEICENQMKNICYELKGFERQILKRVFKLVENNVLMGINYNKNNLEIVNQIEQEIRKIEC